MADNKKNTDNINTESLSGSTSKSGELDDDDEGFGREEGSLLRTALVWGGVVLGVLVVLGVIFVVGLLAGKSAADPGPTEVQSIKSENSVLDSLDTLKDSQVSALSDQYAQMQEKSDTGELSAKERANLVPKSAINNLDPFVGTFYEMSADADKTESARVAQELNSHTSQGAGGSKETPGASAAADSLGQRVVAGDSPSKQLGAKGRKAAKPTLFPMDVASDGSTVVAGVVPFATNTRTVETLFVAKVSATGQISDFQYVGTVDGKVSTFDDARARMVKGDSEGDK